MDETGPRRITVRSLIPEATKKWAYTMLGIFVYYLCPRKRIVLIMSAMRSGSTLLKSLLAEGPDVSMLDEFNFITYADSNRFHFYFKVFVQSRKRIIVLKQPYNNAKKDSSKYGRVPIKGVKKIILYRDPFAALCSLSSLPNSRNIKPVEYWIDSYESILLNIKEEEIYNGDVAVVKYEDLVEKPEDTTMYLFKFIGSVKNKGVDSYTNWKWKPDRDDTSKMIKSLKVQSGRMYHPDCDNDLWESISKNEKIGVIKERLARLSRLCNARFLGTTGNDIST